jgi:uncharacterized protein (UPF0216 family)
LSEIVEKLLQAELRIVNKHLPLERKTLAQLLKEEVPYVRCRDGSIHVFKRSELEKLKNLVNDEEAQKLLLPMIIRVRVDMDTPTGFIEDPLEASVVRRILGLKPPLDNTNQELYLYKPHLFELRYRFSTVFQIAVVVELHSEDLDLLGIQEKP